MEFLLQTLVRAKYRPILLPKRIRMLLAALLISIFAIFALLLWMAGGIQRPRTLNDPPETVPEMATPEVAATSTITVVSWNIAWCYGWGSEGSGKKKDKAHFEKSAKEIGQQIRNMNVDIALLQEVDFVSTRSHERDQAEMIAKEAGLPYLAPAFSWQANWVPFPYWPPSEHFGRMSSGGVILSRYPLETNSVQLLEKPTENPFWYNLFYLFRYLQTAQVKIGDTSITLFNAHLEAFHPGNRMKQANLVQETIARIRTPHVVFGGDLNSVPPESPVRSGYPDEPETNHEEDRTVAILRTVERLHDVISEKLFLESPSDYFTFPAHKPNRKLDYIFAGDGFEVIEARIVKEAGPVSDHLPVLVRLRVKN